jgi:hypothetical protein
MALRVSVKAMSPKAKIVSLTIAFCALTMSAVAFEAVDTTSNAQSTKLILKMNKEFIGGEVQILNANSSLILSQKMKKRKMEINFSAVMAGEYVVRVMKGTQQKEFYFLKK